MSQIPGYNYERSYHTNSKVQHQTSWGDSVPKTGSGNWGSPTSSNLSQPGSGYPILENRHNYQPQKTNQQWIHQGQGLPIQNQGFNPMQQPQIMPTQTNEWNNPTIQQGILQGNSAKGSFGTDSLYNNTHNSGERIQNRGFSNSANTTVLTNRLGQDINLGTLANLVPALFPNPSIKYKILSCLDTSKALDVTSQTNEKKKLKKGRLIIWEYHGGPNQQFYVMPCGNKKVRIINAATGYSIEIPNNSSQDGSYVHVNPNCNTQNEEFELVEFTKDKHKKNIYGIKSFCGKMLDCENQRDSDGTQVIQWTFNGGKNQLWWIIPA